MSRIHGKITFVRRQRWSWQNYNLHCHCNSSCRLWSQGTTCFERPRTLNFRFTRVDIGTEPTPVQGVEGLYGLEMDPESKLSNLLPKLGNMVDGMNSGGGLGGLGGLGMMLDPSAKQELDDIKSDVKTSDMILPGLDEALAFDELLKHVEDPNWDVIVFDTCAHRSHTQVLIFARNN